MKKRIRSDIINKNNLLSKVNSLMISILLTSNFSAKVFASLGFIDENLLPIIFLMSLVISYSTAIILRHSFSNLSMNATLFLYVILIFFLINLFFQGTNSYVSQYFIEFLAFGVIIFLLTILPFSSTDIIIFTMLIGNLILLNPLGYVDFISLDAAYDRVEMGASYAMLPSVVATIIYFLFIRKYDRKPTKLSLISYISNAYMLILLITEGTRGAVLATIVLIVFIFYLKIVNSVNKNFKKIISLTIITTISICSVLVLFNFTSILLWTNGLLQRNGINSATLIKTIEMIENRGMIGILNSRDYLYENALNLFIKSPLWGHGIGSYAEIYGGRYPHNLILHLLVEGGIILTLPFIAIILYCLWIIITPNSSINIEIKLLILMLFVISVPRLMFSSYLWYNQAFWLLIFSALIYTGSLQTYKVKKVLETYNN